MIRRLLASSILATTAAMQLAAADPSARFVYPDRAGKLVYDADARGNRIPDFSHCGYGGGGAAIPNVPTRVTVPPKVGDATSRIQAAIDYVSRLPADQQGLRGAVQLLAGRHSIAGQLRIAASGVVLRGQGAEGGGTTLLATGTDRRTLIRVAGKSDRRISPAVHAVADEYVPVGACTLRLKSTDGLQVGNTVLVTHPSPREWIAAVGMNRFPSRDVGSWLNWQPGKMDVRWDRVITKIDGEAITLDAPLTTALDAATGAGTVASYDWPGRIRQSGVENLRCESAFDPANPLDEEHAWGAIGLENVQDAWVRNVTAVHFAGSAVAVWESCKQITVEDCTSLAPVSELGGYRRHTFFTSGQQTLFRRCRAEQGRHDFSVGYLAAGPNAFVECTADQAHQYSGPIESWASGVLYDNVVMDGGGLALTNRETAAQGAGWAAANCVLWQCTAPLVTCRMPPTAQNWAIGCWGEFVGDGHWRSLNEFVEPKSLYAAQLAERMGAASARPPVPPANTNNAPSLDSLLPLVARPDESPRPTAAPLALKNGWLTIGGKLVTGGRQRTVWWRGSVLPSRAGELGVGITRFVPGREGPGFTDDLDALTNEMVASRRAAIEHHWGLWYDRRRDDHQMVRRIDGEAWPPFYEQPWARSGQGTAWDGLSKYDLTKFNPWYFSRLKTLADLCDRKGLVLIQQMYFQHNILEAGAHWADFPWRPANCLQPTGFPEPPPYVGGKRIFMADAFYDVTHPLRSPPAETLRRELHRTYIRHCLDVLGGNSNVIFMTGEEFTGPLAFVQFWLETIREWQQETGRDVLVGLSCTKDVQDAVLADSQLSGLVDVIDLKYWWYAADGSLYAPAGGESLAPRQQLREWRGSKGRSDGQIARQIRECRSRYPDKAVLCSLEPAGGWTVAAAGGSLAHMPRLDNDQLLAALPRMLPVERSGQWLLADPGNDYFLVATGGKTELDLTNERGEFDCRWIDLRTGRMRPHPASVSAGTTIELTPPEASAWGIWLSRK